ncbi:Amino acid transporter [Thalictrum thalictroides]|uniref:Amino acid transporter n=1 Tax=Thalictrum thalictroides TaxID=46969 RepID=A0A7J6VHE4_THATH|nr:Amino acid transporter [Thalictrum thalictroides]
MAIILVDEESAHLTNPLMFHNNDAKFNNHLDYKEGTTTFFKTCFNGLNALTGVGILSIPYALSAGGWLSLILLISIAAATFFTGVLIRRCMDYNSEIRTYPDIGERAFGRIGRGIVSLFMYLELYFVATGFLILEGDNLQNLFPNMGFEYSWIKISGKDCFVVIVALIILPTVLLEDLSVLSYVSATGVLASATIIFSVLWTGAIDGVGFHEKGRTLNLGGIPTAFSLYAFCYCAHPVFPTLYTSMRDKSQFNKVLLLCFVICTAGYTSMAILGYLMYGENVKSQVTLNLPTGEISSKIAIYTTLVNPVTKYALMVTPIVSAIENHLNYNKKPMNLMIRTLLLMSTAIVAIAVPFFGNLMSLVGAFLSSTASIILPCVCYLKISGSYKRWSFELFSIVGIILMGISIVIIGTYSSLSQIIGLL